MTTRDKAMQILGQLEAMAFPLSDTESSGMYDLLELIKSEYETLLKDIYPDFEE